MCLRLILWTVLLVSVTIILSSSSSEHRLRRRSHSWKACEPFKLPSNAEWIRRWYGRRCKGLFVCCEGYELVVKTVCNKRGRWRVKTFCVPRQTTITPTTSSTTASSTTASSTTASTASSTTASTTEPTTASTSPVTETTTDPVIQCDANPTVENGVITSEISTEVGSAVQFNCTAGFTLNGRVGTLTCSENGEFVSDLVCEDCRMQDQSVFAVLFNDQFEASSEMQCEQLCTNEPECVDSQFVEPDICLFDFTITSFVAEAGSEELCRQSCYDNSRCTAFIAPSIDSQEAPAFCSLFTRSPITPNSVPNAENTFSTCV